MKLSQLNTPNGRAAILAVVALATAGGLKAYYDSVKVTPTTQRDDMVDWLIYQQARLAQEPKAAASLPPVTAWWPANLPCATSITFPTPETSPFAEVIAVPKALDAKIDFSVRLHTPAPGRVVWIARRDRDCDGIYEIHRLEAALTGTGEVYTENLGE